MKNFFKKRISRKDKRVLGSLAFVFFATLIPLMGYAVTSDVSFDERVAASWVFSGSSNFGQVPSADFNPGFFDGSGSSGSGSGSNLGLSGFQHAVSSSWSPSLEVPGVGISTSTSTSVPAGTSTSSNTKSTEGETMLDKARSAIHELVGEERMSTVWRDSPASNAGTSSVSNAPPSTNPLIGRYVGTSDYQLLQESIKVDQWRAEGPLSNTQQNIADAIDKEIRDRFYGGSIKPDGAGGGDIPDGPVCGSYDDLLFVHTLESWPIGGTFCFDGTPEPASPVFPGEGRVSIWKCVKGEEFVACGVGKEFATSCSTNSDCDMSKGEVCFKEAQACITGDIVGTGTININDFLLFKEDFFEYKENGWSESLRRSDLNRDGRISMADFSIFTHSYRLFNSLD